MPAYRLKPAKTITDKSGRQTCEVFGGSDGHDDLSVAWLMMPAGCLRAGERNDFTEVVIVLSGRGRVTIDGKAEDVGAGHSIYVPRGALWQFENTGREPLVCYSICSPALFAGAVH
ncbi:MAG TPA: cupin domain-containing protein [Candidatus Polarisedimenticolia bacterium]|jgi:mannose-6-phosphate isomerase-like protein (cupin superfamily)